VKIRSDILRTYQSIHTWTGIVAGLFLFIGFYAGSLTMFKPQITQWATPSSHNLPQVAGSQLDTLVAQAMASHDKAKQGFIIHFEQDRSPMAWYEQGGGRGLRLDDSLMQASLTETGELITVSSPSNELGTLIDQLHRTAGIVGKLGHEDVGVLVLGVAALLYFLALISGVIFLLPTLMKTLFALRKSKGANRFWLDSHNLVGIFSLPFHLIIAWTVVVFAFHDLLYGGLGLVYGDEPMFEPRERSTISYSVADLPAVSSYFTQLNTLAEGYRIKSMAFSELESTRPSLAVELVADNTIMRGGYSDFIYMNPYTQNIAFNTIADDKAGPYAAIVTSFFGLHFGNYAGNYGRWLYFIMGLLGAFLFYSGNLLWLEKRRQKQALQTRSSHVMAALTVGVCLGSMLGVVCALLATKWLYLFNEQPNHNYLACYYISFFGAIAYAFVRGASIAAIHLLRMLALACLLIPLTSLFLAYLPQLGYLPQLTTWLVRDFYGFSIEILASIFSLLFYLASRKVYRRAHHGEPNSIWAITPKIQQPDHSDNAAMERSLSQPSEI
jgi:uncharacterized iron-regulated membrane protein